MKKPAKLLICIVCILAISFCTVAHAATQANQYINSYFSWLTYSSGDVMVYFNTEGTKTTMSSIGASQIELYEDGVLVKVYLASNPLYTSSMLGYNRGVFVGHVTYPANSGSTYEARVIHYSSDGTGSGAEVSWAN